MINNSHVGSSLNDFLEEEGIMAEIYWHFVDIVWIILFSLIYLLTLL